MLHEPLYPVELNKNRARISNPTSEFKLHNVNLNVVVYCNKNQIKGTKFQGYANLAVYIAIESK